MKLGTENRKELIALGVLGALAIVLVARMVWPSSPGVSQATTATTTGPAVTATRRTASGKIVKVTEPRLDPTLELDVLRQSEETKYEGNGRNIFAMGSVPVKIPVPAGNGTTDFSPKRIVFNTPPPPINLKFFGFANRPGEPKKVFLSQNEDVFIAGEGDIVDRRYRVLHISTASVEVEDVLTNNRQSIPLTQG